MSNWVGIYKMKVTVGNGEKVPEFLKTISSLQMPGNIKQSIARDGDTICGYEEWESSEAHKASMQIPEVGKIYQQIFPLMDGKPEMLFEGESIS